MYIISIKLESVGPSGRGLFESGPESSVDDRLAPSPSPPLIKALLLVGGWLVVSLNRSRLTLSACSLLGADDRDCGNRADEEEPDEILELEPDAILE